MVIAIGMPENLLLNFNVLQEELHPGSDSLSSAENYSHENSPCDQGKKEQKLTENYSFRGSGQKETAGWGEWVKLSRDASGEGKNLLFELIFAEFCGATAGGSRLLLMAYSSAYCASLR